MTECVVRIVRTDRDTPGVYSIRQGRRSQETSIKQIITPEIIYQAVHGERLNTDVHVIVNGPMPFNVLIAPGVKTTLVVSYNPPISVDFEHEHLPSSPEAQKGQPLKRVYQDSLPKGN